MNLPKCSAVPVHEDTFQEANAFNAHSAKFLCKATGSVHALLRALHLCFRTKAVDSRAELERNNAERRRVWA